MPEGGRQDGGAAAAADAAPGGDGPVDPRADASVPVACPESYEIAHGASRYHIVTMAATSYAVNAQAACEQDGTHLPVLDVAGEAEVLLSMIGGNAVWAGVGLVDGSWRWVTGEPLALDDEAWVTGEPGAGERCAHFDGAGLNGTACSQTAFAICECDGRRATVPLPL